MGHERSARGPSPSGSRGSVHPEGGRTRTVIDRRLAEVAILTTAAHWGAEFEWFAHAQRAADAGVPPAAIEAIRDRDEPPFTTHQERTVHDAARHLAATGAMDDHTCAAAHELFGDSGVEPRLRDNEQRVITGKPLRGGPTLQPLSDLEADAQ